MLVTPGMPILDAVEVAQFLIETSVTFERMRADRHIKTVGGPVDIAIITRHEGFRWLQRKRNAPQLRRPPRQLAFRPAPAKAVTAKKD